MASSYRGTGSRLSVLPEEIRQQYAECPACLKEYNDVINVARVLPCLHALCSACAEATASRGAIKCPTCDVRHSVPSDDLEKFPVDETRQFLVNFLKIQRKNPDIVCQECNNKVKVAKQRCRECAQFLCADCMDAHRRPAIQHKNPDIVRQECNNKVKVAKQRCRECAQFLCADCMDAHRRPAIQHKNPDIVCQECNNKVKVAKQRCRECAQFLCADCMDAHRRPAIQRKNPDIVCQECNNKVKVAKQRCRECAQFLCADCMDAHRRPAIQRKNPDIVCQECNNKVKVAKQRCRECAQFLCADCVDAHRRTKVTKKHNILNMEDLREMSLDEFQRPQNCTEPGHEEQPNAFYCSSDSCDRPICATCAVTEHPESKGHEIRDIHEVYGEVKRSVEGLMSDVKHRMLSAQDTASTIEATMEQLDGNLGQTTSQIDANFDNVVRALERRRVELKDIAHTKVKEKKKRLETQLDSINYHINCLEDASEFTSNVTTYGTQSEFLFNKDVVIRRLNSLREEEFDTVPHDNDEIKFRSTNMGDEFAKLVRDVGGVWSTSAYGPNTHVDTNDVTLDREQTILNLTMFDSDGLQQTEGGVDVRVDVTDPSGRRRAATIADNTAAAGQYKAVYMATAKGKHRATVYVNGTPMNNDHVFRAQSPHRVERLNLRGDMLAGEKEDLNSTRPLQTATPSDMSDNMSPISDHVIGDVICPGFVFDATTSNALVDITDEGKTMRARSTKVLSTRRSTREHGRFGVFRGAMASRPFQKAGLYYFEVGVVFKIHTLIRQEQVFEVGLSKLESIDRQATVDCHPYAWTVCARGCHVCGKVCLQTWHNGQLLSHTPVSARTKSPPGTFVRLYYGFLLDAERRHWIVVDVKSKKLIFRFKNLVVSEMSEPLWPVFSVSGPDVVSTAMTLKTGRSVESIPEEALDALAP